MVYKHNVFSLLIKHNNSNMNPKLFTIATLLSSYFASAMETEVWIEPAQHKFDFTGHAHLEAFDPTHVHQPSSKVAKEASHQGYKEYDQLFGQLRSLAGVHTVHEAVEKLTHHVTDLPPHVIKAVVKLQPVAPVHGSDAHRLSKGQELANALHDKLNAIKKAIEHRKVDKYEPILKHLQESYRTIKPLAKALATPSKQLTDVQARMLAFYHQVTKETGHKELPTLNSFYGHKFNDGTTMTSHFYTKLNAEHKAEVKGVVDLYHNLLQQFLNHSYINPKHLHEEVNKIVAMVGKYHHEELKNRVSELQAASQKFNQHWNKIKEAFHVPSNLSFRGFVKQFAIFIGHLEHVAKGHHGNVEEGLKASGENLKKLEETVQKVHQKQIEQMNKKSKTQDGSQTIGDVVDKSKEMEKGKQPLATPFGQQQHQDPQQHTDTHHPEGQHHNLSAEQKAILETSIAAGEKVKAQMNKMIASLKTL